MNIANLLYCAARSFPDRPAVSLGCKPVFDYRLLARRSAALAGALREFLEPGGRIVIALKNCPEYLEIMYGAWTGGFAIAPLNAKLNAHEMAFMVEDCGARVVFADDETASSLAPLVSNVRF